MEHTSKNYEHELNELREKVLLAGGKVEEMIANAMNALTQCDSKMAQDVIISDREMNNLEKQIDELCVNILALRQPTAGDLRFIVTALKIVTDLERIGDLGVNIAERTLELLEDTQLKPYVHLPVLANMSQTMVRDALDAFVSLDTNLAKDVLSRDDAADDLTNKILSELITLMKEDSKNIYRGVRLISVTKYLERIADHATNVAEMVLFLVRGEDVRHQAQN